MPDNAEAHSHTIGTNRNCTVEITNVTGKYCLIEPMVHMESGFSFAPPQPTLIPNKTEVFSFTKDDNTASGAVGVFTYVLFDRQNRRRVGQLFVMFSVPFDYNFYVNWFGVGLTKGKKDCDEKLFKHMYNDKEQTDFVRHKADGAGIVFRGEDLEVRATMSDGGCAIMKLELYDKMS
ncbi:bryoporin-like [Salarias fasciatus]|uniref:Bryoporin-like n=1 Tax=Salarias fasciatus TaxID=181472 RepID=A0A672ITD5_SALFA|nr:bryoporin-like [Salarias fasciatus]